MATVGKLTLCRRLVVCICGAFPHMRGWIGGVFVSRAVEVLVVLVLEEHLDGVVPTFGLSRSDLVNEIVHLFPQVLQLAETGVVHDQSPQCRPLLPQLPSNLPLLS